MKSLYAACIARLGLRESEAATVFAASPDTITGWCSGEVEPPLSAWEDLRDYGAAIAEWTQLSREEWIADGEPLELQIKRLDGPALMGVAEFVLSAPVWVVPSSRAAA